jgi:hypothetical protein
MQHGDTRPRGKRRGHPIERGAACAGVALVALSLSACARARDDDVRATREGPPSTPAAAEQNEPAPSDEPDQGAPAEVAADETPASKPREASETNETRGERPTVREEAPKTETGKVRRPRAFGFKSWKLSVEDARGGGARVDSVQIESPAATLLHPGDVVVAADQRPVKEADDLRAYMGSVAPGTGVLLRVRRKAGDAYVGVQAGAGAAPAPADRAPVSESAAPPAPESVAVPSAAVNAPPRVVVLPAAPAPPPYGAIPFGTGARAVPYGSYGYFQAPPGSEWGSVPPGYYRQAGPGNALTPWPPSAYIPPEPPPR